MSREIKLSAWDIRDKKMVAFESRDYDELDAWIYPMNERWIPMQYTGLKDKNDKEVYEGDIVKCFVSVQRKEPEEFVGSVKFVDGSFMCRYYLGQHYKESEVIGNIYENPELLNEKAN